MSLFKKSSLAIFVFESNSKSPVVTIISSEILFLLVSFLFHPVAVKGISRLISPTKIAYGDFL